MPRNAVRFADSKKERDRANTVKKDAHIAAFKNTPASKEMNLTDNTVAMIYSEISNEISKEKKETPPDIFDIQACVDFCLFAWYLLYKERQTDAIVALGKKCLMGHFQVFFITLFAYPFCGTMWYNVVTAAQFAVVLSVVFRTTEQLQRYFHRMNPAIGYNWYPFYGGTSAVSVITILNYFRLMNTDWSNAEIVSVIIAIVLVVLLVFNDQVYFYLFGLFFMTCALPVFLWLEMDAASVVNRFETAGTNADWTRGSISLFLHVMNLFCCMLTMAMFHYWYKMHTWINICVDNPLVPPTEYIRTIRYQDKWAKKSIKTIKRNRGTLSIALPIYFVFAMFAMCSVNLGVRGMIKSTNVCGDNHTCKYLVKNVCASMKSNCFRKLETCVDVTFAELGHYKETYTPANPTYTQQWFLDPKVKAFHAAMMANRLPRVGIRLFAPIDVATMSFLENPALASQWRSKNETKQQVIDCLGIHLPVDARDDDFSPWRIYANCVSGSGNTCYSAVFGKEIDMSTSTIFTGMTSIMALLSSYNNIVLKGVSVSSAVQTAAIKNAGVLAGIFKMVPSFPAAVFTSLREITGLGLTEAAKTAAGAAVVAAAANAAAAPVVAPSFAMASAIPVIMTRSRARA